ncbi:MAG: ABC-type transport system involved in cytochrome c biogenesis permease subunit [Cryomorphaceae bacterium]|jgi:ABC-type transport system involved in cytochrome c biogenesis permease subunit
MNKKVRLLGFSLTMLVILAVAGVGIRSLIVPTLPKEVIGYTKWDKRVVVEMQTLPVQDGGRVKPFQTLARRYMYAMHGDRGMKVLIDGEKQKLTPTEWMMDVIFRPEMADHLPSFRVDNSEILEQVGMDVKSLRDRYSFDQIRPYLPQLQEFVETINKQINKAGQKSLSPEQEQMHAFYRLLQSYVALKNLFIISDELKELTGYPDIESYFESNKNQLPTERLAQIADNKMQMRIIGVLDNKVVADAQLLMGIRGFGEFSKLIINPTKGEKTWTPIGPRFAEVARPNHDAYKVYADEVADLKSKHRGLTEANVSAFYADYIPIFLRYSAQQKKYPDDVITELIELEKLQFSFSLGNAGKQLDGINAFKKKYANHVDFGDEGGHLSGEVMLNKMSYFNNGIAILLFAGILLIAMCLCLGTRLSKILYWGVYGLTSLACLFTVVGIAHRSWIMNRPPIGTLYDTMPFIVGAGLVLLLLLEWIHKKGILLGVAICFGVAILFLAKSYEVSEARDQMDPLVAVLKSNYWLATHVVMITLGYMGGIVAACISHFYIIGRAFGLIDNKETRVYLTKIVYGMVAFTLLFSLVGTILGGIWAADSWGRFWGWDPKENGALLIVIWMLVILHSRLGGYIKEIGLHVCSVFGFMIIVFSWWHVNFLGVGLHNYGFTSSKAMTNIWVFYGMEFLIMMVGMVMALIVIEQQRAKKHRKKMEQVGVENL